MLCVCLFRSVNRCRDEPVDPGGCVNIRGRRRTRGAILPQAPIIPGRPMSRLPRTILVPLVVACALFMEQFDGTVIATALPQIAVAVGTDPVRLSLAVTAYLLSLGVFIPVSGWFADRFGARTVFLAAIAVFIVGSVLCGLSGSLATLTTARALQGVGGAMMVPVGRLILLRNIPKAD